MPANSSNPIPDKITYLTGSPEIIGEMRNIPARRPFDQEVCGFLNDLSKTLMKDPRSRAYSDVITFAFWIRKASLEQLKEKYLTDGQDPVLGRGTAFHIAPSNVPVNFAYSLVAGLLTGNSNVVRIPSKDFPQVNILTDGINHVLSGHEEMRPYIALIRYGRDKEVNDFLSSIADTRIIWGGDQTIRELRLSPLPARSTEITFADRYSMAIVDSDTYLDMQDKKAVAQDFYNDTYFSDQNACTSPRIVIWTGNQADEAREVFWKELHSLVMKKYNFQSIQAINKLTSIYLAAADQPGIHVEKSPDNLIVRLRLPELTEKTMDHIDNSGFFYEYLCRDILELKPICDDKRCQTVGMIGDKKLVLPLIESGIRGIDRVVPVGKTMDFDLIWDGYDLVSQLTRRIHLS